MDIDKLINSMTPEIYQAFKRAIEIGKWPDGKPVSDEQRALCMEAVITYEHKFVEERHRVGYIDRGHKQEGEQCGDKSDESPITWR